MALCSSRNRLYFIAVAVAAAIDYISLEQRLMALHSSRYQLYFTGAAVDGAL